VNSAEKVRLAVDIGGTFTDVVVLRESGRRITTKALTTPDDPGRGVLDGLHLAAHQLGMSVGDLLGRTVTFVHGTTVGTNALVQRRGARTGLLMTRGHEQTIIIGRVRQKITGLSEREKIHVTHLHKAEPPIVAPEDIRGVAERIDARGHVVVALDEVGACGAVDDLCAPQKARYTVINGRVVVEQGRVVTVNMQPVVEAHNRFARQFAQQS
jgi:N-methylhydantoinase A